MQQVHSTGEKYSAESLLHSKIMVFLIFDLVNLVCGVFSYFAVSIENIWTRRMLLGGFFDVNQKV